MGRLDCLVVISALFSAIHGVTRLLLDALSLARDQMLERTSNENSHRDRRLDRGVDREV